jgi:hypothetical protein
LGIAYLENCDDTRNTPTLGLIDALKGAGGSPGHHKGRSDGGAGRPLGAEAGLFADLPGSAAAGGEAVRSEPGEVVVRPDTANAISFMEVN